VVDNHNEGNSNGESNEEAASVVARRRAYVEGATVVREKTKASVVARKLKRTEGATRQKASVLGVKLVGAQRKRKP
jgi:hypothetical protein